MSDWKSAALLVLCFGAPIASCGTDIQLTVKDASTGQPIPDAVVVVIWETRHNGLLHSGPTICERVESARTGANGHVRIADAHKGKPRIHTVYKQGDVAGARDDSVQLMNRAEPNASSRFSLLMNEAQLSCRYSVQRDALDFFVAVHREAAGLANSDSEKRLLSALKMTIDDIKTGREGPGL